MSTTTTVEWRCAPGFSSWEVSSEGEIRNRKTKRIRKCTDNGYGYLKVNLCNDRGRHKSAKVHVLVALAFHGPRPDGMQVAHVDGNRHNNRAENLTYASPTENALHMRYHGTAPCPIVAKQNEREREKQKRAEDRAKRIAMPRRARPGPHPWAQGERNSQAKLTEEQVRAIRSRHAAGESMASLARWCGVSATHIARIVHGLKWRTCSATKQAETTQCHQDAQDAPGSHGATGVQVRE